MDGGLHLDPGPFSNGDSVGFAAGGGAWRRASVYV
jgi:hypothetical protein